MDFLQFRYFKIIMVNVSSHMYGPHKIVSRQIVFGIGRVEVNLRQKLFEHLLIQDPDWIQKKGSGDIISRATSDVENIEGF